MQYRNAIDSGNYRPLHSTPSYNNTRKTFITTETAVQAKKKTKKASNSNCWRQHYCHVPHKKEQ